LNKDKIWGPRLATYRATNNGRASLELGITLVPFVVLYAAMIWSLSVGYWLTLLLALPTAAMLVRMFAIQHDCGHGAFWSSKRANDWLGRFIGVLTFTAYDDWRREHALHHSCSGNLDRRGFGDIATLTVREYCALSKVQRLGYWLYRHPVVLFGLGPSWLFLLRHRWPSSKTNNMMPLLSTHSTNIGIVFISVALIWLIGWKAFLMVQVPVIVLAASVGVWLFYIQHQFDETHWENNPDWQREHAALHGSSYYDLPQPLMWLTGNLGIHHVHHLSSSIPFHKLPRVMRDYPELKDINRLTLWRSLRCVPLTLWDEEKKALISFRQRRRAALASV